MQNGSHSTVQRTYDAALILTAIALPFSNFLMSQGAFLLVLAWAVDRWKNGPLFRGRTWSFWQSQLVLWGVLALFSWHLLSQLWSTDWAYGWRALRIELPLLAFPLILISGRWNQPRGLNVVQHALAVAVVAACAACLWIGYHHEGEMQARDWSPFISHIRFSLLITFIWGWWLHRWMLHKEAVAAIFLTLIGVLGGLFTWKVASLTGAILFPVVALIVFWLANRGRKLVVAMAGAGIAAVAFLGWNLRPVYPDAQDMLKSTAKGELYEHYPERCLRENGHHVWTLIAQTELGEGWAKRSELSIEGIDGRNQELRMTLMRFLTSKGLAKDLDGVSQLSDQEIRWIESGIPTILELEHHGLLRRMEAVQFEVWNMLDGGNPGGHSIVQRFAFLRAAFHIYQNYPVFGVGIGDVRQSFDWAYAELKSPLAPEFRLRAHNQFVTFLLAGGPLNLILWTAILVALAFGGYRPSDRPIQQIALLFVWVLALSCLTEDTLETQAGVTFAGFFIGLLGRRSHSQLS